MNSSRLERLKAFLKDEPNDPFTLYAIATEYRDNNPQKAMELFEDLLSKHENYLATYYHLADLYVDFDDRDKAEDLYVRGIALAKKQDNYLALRELQNAYNEFLFEE